ncbi:hypothetical protein D3C72_427350 [compost metagenome]
MSFILINNGPNENDYFLQRTQTLDVTGKKKGYDYRKGVSAEYEMDCRARQPGPKL